MQQVHTVWEKNEKLAQDIDSRMVESVQEAKLALEQGGEQAMKHLAYAMNKAGDCFFEWGLVSESLQHHMNQLRVEGALAVKPTGSGGGGYVVSLWDKRPPTMDFELICV